MKKFDGVLILTDIDGTLMIGKDIPQNNIDAINYFTENGGLFSVATGRSPEYLYNFPELNINAPIAVINGTVIYDLKTKKVLRSCTMPKEYISAAIEVCRMFDITRISVGSVYERFYENPKEIDFTQFTEPINKFVFAFGDEAEALRAKKYLIDTYGDTCDIERSWNTGVEIRIKEGSKGNSLLEIKKMTGATIAIGVGDYENDITLLKCADISFAPENALPEIKAVADYVTVPCVNGAIADVIRRLEEKTAGRG